MNQVPTYQGWSTFVLKRMAGEAEPFTCPSDETPWPIPAVSVSQRWREGYGAGGARPSLAPDSAYLRRGGPSVSGLHHVDLEIGAAEVGYDSDYNDGIIRYKTDGPRSKYGTVWASANAPGFVLNLHDWRGGTLAVMPEGGATEKFSVPTLWGSHGMNLSAGVRGAKPWNVLFLDYEEWSAVMEPALQAKDVNGQIRFDNPKRMVAFRHNRRANVGFLDLHVESLVPRKLNRPDNPLAGSIWHPERPPNWKPSFLN